MRSLFRNFKYFVFCTIASSVFAALCHEKCLAAHAAFEDLRLKADFMASDGAQAPGSVSDPPELNLVEDRGALTVPRHGGVKDPKSAGSEATPNFGGADVISRFNSSARGFVASKKASRRGHGPLLSDGGLTAERESGLEFMAAGGRDGEGHGGTAAEGRPGEKGIRGGGEPARFNYVPPGQKADPLFLTEEPDSRRRLLLYANDAIVGSVLAYPMMALRYYADRHFGDRIAQARKAVERNFGRPAAKLKDDFRKRAFGSYGRDAELDFFYMRQILGLRLRY